MARPVYSALLGEITSVSDPAAFLAVPDDQTWVIRSLSATFGSYAGYAVAGVALDGEDPWLWLCTAPVGALFSDHPVTWTWEGRLVLPSGSVWWAQALDGDTCDMLASGYKLTN